MKQVLPFGVVVALEGKHLIQTEEPNLSPVEAVTVHKDLSEVERAFAELKDVIEMRPSYHHTAEGVRAHIFVASLAFLLDRALEKKLKASDLDISSKEAWQLLKTVRVVEIDAHGPKAGGLETLRKRRSFFFNRLRPHAIIRGGESQGPRSGQTTNQSQQHSVSTCALSHNLRSTTDDQQWSPFQGRLSSRLVFFVG